MDQMWSRSVESSEEETGSSPSLGPWTIWGVTALAVQGRGGGRVVKLNEIFAGGESLLPG